MHRWVLVQLSAFNVYVESFPSPGETLIYNTFSGGSAVLEDALVAQLRAAGADAEPDADLSDPDLGILVENRAAEEREFTAWLRRVKEDRATVSALVSTSYACNLACTYCFQEKIMNGRTMTPALADATVEFLGGRVRDVKPEKLEVVFIGGEPLLHPHLIERMALGLAPICRETGTHFAFEIITNGTLMTRPMVERFVSLGLNSIQVTIDGDECSHGITRVDKKGRNSFQTTWRNVLACIDLVPISIQGNYSDENIHGFIPLLERMKRDGVAPSRVPRIKFKPALEGLGSPDSAGMESCTWSNAKPEVQIALGDAVRAFGYTPHDHLDLGPCSIHQINHFSIGAEGLIFKCPGFVGKAEWATGHVETGLTDKHRRLNLLANTRECGGCGYRPNCAGGCIATQWVASGLPEGQNCERTYFDTVGIDAIKRNYFFDTMERADAIEAVHGLPGRTELPSSKTLPRPMPTVAPTPLIQLRTPRRALATMEMRP